MFFNKSVLHLPNQPCSSREDNPELAAMFAAEHKSCQVKSSTNLVHSVSRCCIYSLTMSDIGGWRTLECFEKHYVQVKALAVSFGRWACFHTVYIMVVVRICAKSMAIIYFT